MGGSRTGKRRSWLPWLLSIACGAGLLALTSRFVPLVPDPLEVPRMDLLMLAIAVQLPYAWLRADRLRFMLDPLVADASGESSRFPRRALLGSGLVGFFAVIFFPLRLGEVSRPLLLARAEAPGVGVPEAAACVAAERILDGLCVVAMLFVGLALVDVASVDPGTLALVHTSGKVMLVAFTAALVVLALGARMPERAASLVERVPGVPRALTQVIRRVLVSLAPLWRPSAGVPFVGATAAYWAVTVGQSLLVARACGLDLGFADAALIVAVVGLSIQLPGGPAQAGSFQVGVAVGLSLTLGAAAQSAGAASFGALTYGIQLVGAGLLAMVGAAMLGKPASASPPDPGQKP